MGDYGAVFSIGTLHFTDYAMLQSGEMDQEGARLGKGSWVRRQMAVKVFQARNGGARPR